MLNLYFNRRDSVSNVLNREIKEENILVFGFNGTPKISYKMELSGENRELSKIVELSKKGNKTVISGAITDNFGIIRKSVLVADNGKLLGISDMNMCLDKEGYSSGTGHRIYHTKNGKIGVLVGDDIIDLDGIKAMSICGADLIVIILSKQETNIDSVLVRAYSYLFGVPVVVFTSSSVIAGDIRGEICSGSYDEECKIVVPLKKSYRLCQIKKRGIKI